MIRELSKPFDPNTDREGYVIHRPGVGGLDVIALAEDRREAEIYATQHDLTAMHRRTGLRYFPNRGRWISFGELTGGAREPRGGYRGKKEGVK